MKRLYFPLLACCAMLALFALVYPVYVIRPFRAQGVRELAAALALLRVRPAAMIALVAASALLTFGWWREQRGWRRAAVCLPAAVVCAAAALSRVNIYELMFHPMERPRFTAASEMKLDGDEKVLAIRAGGAARAYPIRSISYHHVVNDRLGGVAVVATY